MWRVRSCRNPSDWTTPNSDRKRQQQEPGASVRDFPGASRWSAAVTDVLIDRGDAQVVLSTTENRGAQLSNSGFARLIQRLEGDDRLAASVGSRADIPWHQFTALLAKASDHVRARLVAEHPHAEAEVGRAVEEIASRIADEHAVATAGNSDLQAYLGAMHRSGQLDDEQIRCFAEDGLAEQVTLSLSLVSQLPAEFIQQALVQESGGSCTRACPGKRALLVHREEHACASGQQTPQDAERDPAMPGALLEKLNRATAAEIMQFYKARGAA